MSVIFITHKVREVLSICDRISVMREGRHVITLDREHTADEELVKAMVGDELDLEQSLLFTKGNEVSRPVDIDKKPVLEVDGLRVVGEEETPLINNCSFKIHAGEILGIAGVAGNGQRELVESLLDLLPATEGHISFNGVDITETKTAKLLAMGVTYIPEDRLQDGFLPTANVAQNLILGFHREKTYNKSGFLNWKTVFSMAKRMIAEYNIKTPGPEEAAANLSGGNIQRVMLARAFSHPSRFLIAHNPTRGLDIPSVEFVYSKILELRKQGVAILLLSEDMDVLLFLSDRIAVLYKGQIVGILERNEFDRYEIGRMMSGVPR